MLKLWNSEVMNNFRENMEGSSALLNDYTTWYFWEDQH